MKCSDLQFNLSLYTDGALSESESASIKGHLVVCPLCRQKNSDFRELRVSLQAFRRPEMPQNLRRDLRSSVRTELRNERESVIPVSSDIREWLQMRLMPYTVGIFASLLIGSTFLTMMFSGMLRPKPATVASSNVDHSLMLANNSNPFPDDKSAFISPIDFANSRMAFSSESPSINPQGGLVALTKSILRGEMKDEEVVVVADVFGNGLARISEVVESPESGMALIRLERALQSDPSFAPFVPAVMENRPENMRIVLKFKSVDVSMRSKPARRPS